MIDDPKFIDLTAVKRGRPPLPQKIWYGFFRKQKNDKLHRLVSRFHNGDDSVIPELEALGIKAIRPSERK